MADIDRNWRGTAAQLAAEATNRLTALGREESALSERLVRYYVHSEVLSRPEREGREAVFAYRQLLQLLVARELAQDGWPLAKIAAWNQAADEKALLDLIDNRSATAPSLMQDLVARRFPETRRLVLAVNDDPYSDGELYEWLAARGAAVLRAYSTAHALTLLRRARVHVVISDLARVEDGVLNKRAGMALAREIRDLESDVPLVIFTLDKSPLVKDLAVEAGANYVTESADDLLDWLEKIGI